MARFDPGLIRLHMLIVFDELHPYALCNAIQLIYKYIISTHLSHWEAHDPNKTMGLPGVRVFMGCLDPPKACTFGFSYVEIIILHLLCLP